MAQAESGCRSYHSAFEMQHRYMPCCMVVKHAASEDLTGVLRAALGGQALPCTYPSFNELEGADVITMYSLPFG